MDEPDDSVLLHKWRSGDKSAGTALFRRHFTAVRRFFRNKIGPQEVEDLVQRTFATLVESADNFRGESSFRGFVFGVARNQLYKFLRDRGRRTARQDADVGVSSIAALGQTPSALLGVSEEQTLIQRALQCVCVDHQVVLELYYWEDLTSPEIARVLGIAPATARTRLHRARNALEEELRKLDSAAVLDIEATLRSVGTLL